MSDRATLLLELECNNRCVFCAQAGLDTAALPRQDWRESLRRLRDVADELTFVGGEPALHPEIVEIVASARAAGFVAVGLQTNGRSLSDPSLLARLVDAGLSDVHLSIHGAEAAIHDYHTGTAGSFAAIHKAARELDRLRIPWVTTTVVTRSNFRGLADLASLLSSLRSAAWMLAWPRVYGRAADDFDRVVPRYGLAVPFVLHATKIAIALGLPVGLRGIPTCTLGPYATHRVDGDRRAFGDVCESCTAGSSCAGVDDHYLLRYGEGELHPPAEAHDRSPTPLDSALARMFVGIGPRVERTPPTRAPSPAEARRSLPILGRPHPGRAEIRQRPQTDAEALRTLFPTLYGENDADE